MTLAPYPSPHARDTELRRLAERTGAELVVYGASRQGRPLVAARQPRPGAPRVLCSAGIHGPEFIATRVAMGVLEASVHYTWSTDVELWVIPCLNPDGYAQTWEQAGQGTLAQLRTNAAGVDLNRNFPCPGAAGWSANWVPGAGSRVHGHATYRGPHPLSEPETARLDELLTRWSFHASANVHSFMGTLIPARVRDRASFRSYKQLTRTFARAQPSAVYRRLSSRLFDVFTGEQEDHQHHHHGTWAVCVESFPWTASFRQHVRAPSLFWRFNPRDPTPWVSNDVPGIVAMLEVAASYPRPTRTKHDVRAYGSLSGQTGS